MSDTISWKTARNYHDEISKGEGETFNDPSAILGDISQEGVYTIEIEIKDSRDVWRRGFYIPLLFRHAFNVVILSDKVEIRQSWFNRYNHGLFEYMPIAEFKSWTARLYEALRDFRERPEALFSFFGYTSFNEIDYVLKYIKTCLIEERYKIFIRYP